MRRRHLALATLLLLLSLPSGSAVGTETSNQCPPTPGIAANQDVVRGKCLFNSSTVFGQDPTGPFASCSRCHYGSEKTDRSVHVVRVTNQAGQTIEVLRKTPSLLKASHNAPFGFDGRFATVQEAARGAILSPVEMRGTTVTNDQLDAIAAYVLGLPFSDADSHDATMPDTVDSGTLNQIAIGHGVFFGNGTCSTCHSGPDFTNHAMATNQVNLTFSGGTDPGAAFVGTGPVGHFKVQSLLFFNEGARPAMHSGAMDKIEQIIRFYNVSLRLGLTGAQQTGLGYWLRNCLDPRRTPQPSTC
jgi:cytochrome c peroxidase